MYQSDLSNVLFEIIDLPANSPLTAEDIVGDGYNYKKDLFWQSPEGNFFGNTKWVADWYLHLLWDGRNYIEYSPKGTVASVSDLPTEASYMDVWSILNADVAKEPEYQYDKSISIAFLPAYYYDPDTGWNLVEFGRFVDDTADIPYPGYRIGSMITVVLHDVMVYWDGFRWSLPKHSNLLDDEPERHLPAGFINFITPDVKLVYGSRKLLFLDKVSGGTGFVNVNKQIIQGGNSCCVYNTFPVLNYVNGVIVPSAVQNITGYYVYVANKTAQFQITFSNKSYDFRGKLFLSNTTPDYTTFGGLGDAVVVGRIETTSEGYFRHELDISWISRRPSFTETYRDYSDFVLSYVDIHEIRLYCIDGHYGQMYIPEELVYLGNDLPVYYDSPRIEVDEDEQPVLDTSTISPNTEYFLYIINEVDAVNFNEINPETGRPWCRNDVGAEENYDPDKDLRLKVVLSTKPPEPEDEFRNNIVPLTCGRMTESYPLFYSRYLGHVWTDANGYFLYAKDISAIRTLALNPTHFRGQADFAIKPVSELKFKVAEIPGTAGVVSVGGQNIFTLPEDYDEVHEFDVNDYIQIYTEANIPAPLSDSTTVVSHPNTTFYIYLCNNDECWGLRKNKLFASTIEPTRGYLSVNYPGTNARWIATIKTDGDGKLTGYWLLDSPGNQDAALLNLNDIANGLSGHTNALFAHDSLLDQHDQFILALLGADSNFFIWYESLSQAMLNAFSDLDELSGDLSNIGVDYDNIYSLTVDMSAEIDSLYSDVFAILSNANDIYSDIMVISSITQDLYSDLGNLSLGISALNQNVDDLYSDIGDLSAVISNINDDVIDLGSDIDAIGVNIQAIYSDIGDISGDISNINVDIANLGSDYSVMSALTHELDSQVESLHSYMDHFDSDLDALSGVIDLIGEQTALLGSDYSILLEDYEGITSALDLVYSDVANIESDISMIEIAASNIEIYTNAIGSDLSALSEVVSDIGVNYLHISAITDSLASLHDDLVDEHLTLSQNVSALSTVYLAISEDVVSISNTTNSLLSDFDVLSGLIDAVSSVASNLQDDVSLVSAYALQIYDDVSLLSEHFAGLFQELYDVSAIMNSLDSDLLMLFSDLSYNPGEPWRVWSDIYEMSVDLDALHDEMDDVWSQVSLISTDINSLYDHTASLLSAVDLLGDDIDSLQSLIDNLEGVTQTLGSDISLLQVAASDLGDDVESLGLLIDSLDSNVEEIGDTISTIGEYLGSLSDETSLLGVNLESLSDEASQLGEDYHSLSYWVSFLDVYTDSLSLDLSQLDIDLGLLSGEIDSMGSHLSLFGDDLTSLSGLVDWADSLIDSLYADFSLISFTVNQIDTTVANMLSQLGVINEDYDLLICHMGDLEAHYNQLIVDVNSLDANYDVLVIDYLSLSGDVNFLQTTFDSLVIDLVSLSDTVDFIENTYSALEIDVGDLSVAVVSALTDYYDMSENIDSLLSDLGELSETWYNLDLWVESLFSDLLMASEHIWEVYSDLYDMSEAFNGLLSGLADGFIGDFRLPTYDWVGKRFKYEDQKAGGLPIKVSWYHSDIVIIEPTEDDAQIVLPNATVGIIDGRAAIRLSNLSEDDVMYWLAIKGEQYGGTEHLCIGSLFEVSPHTMVTGYSLGQTMSLIQSGASGGYAYVTEVRDGIVGGHVLRDHGSLYQPGDVFTLVQGGGNRTALFTVKEVGNIARVSPDIVLGGSNYVVNDIVSVTQEGRTSLQVKVAAVVTGQVVTVEHVAGTGLSWIKNSAIFNIAGGNQNDPCRIQVTSISGNVVNFSVLRRGSGYSAGEKGTTAVNITPDGADPLRVTITVSGSGSISVADYYSGGMDYTPANNLSSSAVTGIGSGATFNITPYHVIGGAIREWWNGGWEVTNTGKNYIASSSLLAYADTIYHDNTLLKCHGSGASFELLDVFNGYVLGLGVSQGGSGYKQGVATTDGDLEVSVDGVWAKQSAFYTTRDENKANRKIFSATSARKSNPSGSFDSLDIAYLVASSTNNISGPWSVWSIYSDVIEELLAADGIGDNVIETFGIGGLENIIHPTNTAGFKFLRSHPTSTRFRIDASGLTFQKAVSYVREPYTNTIQYGFMSIYNQAFVNGGAGPYIVSQVETTKSMGDMFYPSDYTGSSWTIVDLTGDYPVDVISALRRTDAQASVMTMPELGFTQINTSTPRIFDYTGGLEQKIDDPIFIGAIKTVLGVISVDNAGCAGLMYIYRTRSDRPVILRSAVSKQ